MDKMNNGCIGLAISAVVTSLAAWVTHVVVCIQAQAWIFLTIGGFIAPIGVVHGVMVWFGSGAV